jgi:hypothetical protein
VLDCIGNEQEDLTRKKSQNPKDSQTKKPREPAESLLPRIFIRSRKNEYNVVVAAL